MVHDIPSHSDMGVLLFRVQILGTVFGIRIFIKLTEYSNRGYGL